jgi:hypothetical protein
MDTQIGKRYDDSFENLVYGVLIADDGRQLNVDSIVLTITIDGTELSLAGVPTEDPNTGILSYAWTGTDLNVLDANLGVEHNRAVWEFTVGAETFERVQWFDIRAVVLRSNVASKDIDQLNGDFRSRHLEEESYSATDNGGDLVSIIDTKNLHTFESNSLAGSVIRGLESLNHGHSRNIVSNDNATATITVDVDFPAEFKVNHRYAIIYSWNNFIAQAWKQIQARVAELIGKHGHLKWIDGNDVSEAHLYKAAAMAAETLSNNPNDHMHTLANSYNATYEAWMGRLELKLNDGESGDVVGTRKPKMEWSK